MSSTFDLLDPFTRIRPGSFISQYSDWVLFTLLLFFFWAVAGIALRRRFQESRHLRVLITSIALALAVGTYYIQAICTKAWGGGASNDAMMVMKHFAKLFQLTGLRLAAGDIDGSGSVNSIDALYLAQRFVFMINSFPVGDWVYENNLITINGSNLVHNIKGLCVGDVDGSYIVP